MKISLLMGANRTYRGLKVHRDSRETLEELYDIGYRSIDFPFTGTDNPGFILNQEDWRSRIEAVARRAQELGVTFDQCHLPFPRGAGFRDDKRFQQSGFQEHFDTCMARSIEAASILGVKYATAHPLSDTEMLADANHQREINHAYYDKFVQQAASLGVGIAFENMRIQIPLGDWPYRYCCHVDELVDLIDSFADPLVGGCWDTGHGHTQKQNQRIAINKLGSRLRNLHINDCEYKKRDEHLLPYMGTIDWNDFVEGLLDVNYRGVLNYEVGKVTLGCPAQLQKIMLQSVYNNGLILLEQYEQALKRRTGEEG